MIPTVFRQLKGPWSFHRTFSGGGVVGSARFTEQSPTEFLYREEGTMTLNGQSGVVYREYVYRLEENKIVTFFNENPPRLFQELTFSQADDYPCEARGEHLCECDLYKAKYTFLSPNEFSQEQTVRGPQKDYVIRTFFKKTHGEP